MPEAQAESRSFQVKVTGPCPPGVYTGMFGRIFIPLEEEEVLVVPRQAVRQVGQLEEVDVVEDGRTMPPRGPHRPGASDDECRGALRPARGRAGCRRLRTSRFDRRTERID